MIRTFLVSSALALMLMSPGDVRAQYGYGYPGGYGGYGWGGWGSTPQSLLARGLGSFNMGRGAYNYDTAMAGSINTNTVMRWNQYAFQSAQAAGSRNAAHGRARRAANIREQAEIHNRVRNHPETLDIVDGDALNALLDELINPAILNSSLRLIKTPLKPDLIQDIPFEYASEGMTVCLDQMTLNDQWPLALRVEAFRADRESVRKAIFAALEQDKEGDIEPRTIEAVKSAIDQLRLKFEKTVLQTSPDYIPARDTLKALAGLTKMLYSPKMEQVIAELDDYQGTTLGDLLAFMQAFNLRFAPANSFRERRIYMKLYPMLAEQTNGSLGVEASNMGKAVEKAGGEVVQAAEGTGRKVISDVENLGGEVVGGLKSAAIDLFKDMDWKHLTGSGKPSPSQP